MSDVLLTVANVASRLQVPVSTARKLVVSGAMRGLKVGNRWRVEPADYDAYLDQQRNKAMPRQRVDITKLPGFPRKRVFG